VCFLTAKTERKFKRINSVVAGALTFVVLSAPLRLVFFTAKTQRNFKRIKLAVRAE
jgi:hypothetical protein